MITTNWIHYKNGNYNVHLNIETGTKIRQNNLDYFYPEFPESMDVKITNQCDMGCPYCHEDSTKDGKHGDILNAKFIETLHPYTELAIGGGNPLSHPDLIKFLEKCEKYQLIPSMTINQKHFESDYDKVKDLIDKKLIYGLGVSITSVNDKLLDKLKSYKNIVCHVIAGVVTKDTLEKLAHNNLKILILGYKIFRRGQDYYTDEPTYVQEKVKMISDLLPEMQSGNWFNVISFDNLAVKQLNPKRLLSEELYNKLYMGDDGFCTMFIDLVKNEFAESSTSNKRYQLEDNIQYMFSVIRKR